MSEGQAETRGRAPRTLRRWAAGARAPVFAIAGAGGRETVRRLKLCPDIELVSSPRSASILLVAGSLPISLVRSAIRIHDQMPHPRATAFYVPGRWEALSSRFQERFFPFATVTADGDSAEDSVRFLYRDLLAGDRTSDPGIQPDRPPLPWRGRGPYGHGGKGMTGGAPYGRPMPQRGSDPDGLDLDRLLMRVGPFFPPLPSGLTLDLEFQGDVIRHVEIGRNPFRGMISEAVADPFLAALHAPVPIVEIELARARSHLLWLSDALHMVGLKALGVRTLAHAETLRSATTPPSGDVIRRMLRRLARSRSVAWATRGVGQFAPPGLSGPVSRAAGAEEDARCDDPTYAALGFRPVTHSEGDAWARWRQRIAECQQSLDLAAMAGDRRTRPNGAVEAPRGTLRADGVFGGLGTEELPDLLDGLEWGDAVTTIVSLDLDLDLEARYRS